MTLKNDVEAPEQFVERRGAMAGVAVVVVDDASPVPTAAKLASLGAIQRLPGRVILQPNAGPGAARNAALSLIFGDNRPERQSGSCSHSDFGAGDDGQ